MLDLLYSLNTSINKFNYLPELLVGVLEGTGLAESVSVTDNIKAGRLAGDLLGIGAIICK